MAHLIQFPKIIGENKIEQLRRVAPDYMADHKAILLILPSPSQPSAGCSMVAAIASMTKASTA